MTISSHRYFLYTDRMGEQQICIIAETQKRPEWMCRSDTKVAVLSGN